MLLTTFWYSAGPRLSVFFHGAHSDPAYCGSRVISASGANQYILWCDRCRCHLFLLLLVSDKMNVSLCQRLNLFCVCSSCKNASIRLETIFLWCELVGPTSQRDSTSVWYDSTGLEGPWVKAWYNSFLVHQIEVDLNCRLSRKLIRAIVSSSMKWYVRYCCSEFWCWVIVPVLCGPIFRVKRSG